MVNYFDPLQIRKKLGNYGLYTLAMWKPPYEFMKGQWVFDSKDGARVIVSSAPYETGNEGEIEWLHASISRKEMPTYDDLVMIFESVFNDGWAYQVFAPAIRHINIHSKALHLFGRLDGKMIHPDFQVLSGINSI